MNLRRPLLLLILILSALIFPAGHSSAQDDPAPVLDTRRLEGSVSAPDFPDHLEWLNTRQKISLQDLRGKIVLLDFWTYCCINCMHVIPDLKKLEAKYPDELVVIGVHSAKFTNEKETESIRQAVMRYGIKHPVMNDKDMELWQEYGVHAWPTLVLINPHGRIIGMRSGEGVFEFFDPLIQKTLDYFDAQGKISRQPLKLSLEEKKRPKTILAFPGKVRADSAKQLLYISDTNHNRIVITDLQGKIQDIIGSGKEGRSDGTFETAELNHPQGVFVRGDLLYIADTENHLIREADLKTRRVKTLFGTGLKAAGPETKGFGTQAALSSPWDLTAEGNKLYIAMAGLHQIYAASLETGEVTLHAGSGREAKIDGLLQEAALAQPSAITSDGNKLYFADSEVSAVRSADIHPGGRVETIIGEDLFEFGDIDGTHRRARLQHPLGIDYDPSGRRLFVADTYNSKIKVIDPEKKTSTAWVGTGKHGYLDGKPETAQFFEPGGLSVWGDYLYVADTNNHQIRVVNVKSQEVSTLMLSGLDVLARRTLNPFKGRVVEAEPIVVKEGRAMVKLVFELPKGYHFNEEAPFRVEWKSQGTNVVFKSDTNYLDQGRFSSPIEIPAVAKQGSDDLYFDAMVYYCRDNSKICLFDHVRIHVPVKVRRIGFSQMTVKVEVLPKKR